MKAIKLALLELRRFRGGPLRRLVPAALLLVPLLYGSLSLWSDWDPYGSLDELPVAVVNSDRPVTGGGQYINAGEQFVQQLKATGLFDWHFVDAAEARDGLLEGRYYLTISIPAGFSAKLATATRANPEHAVLTITKNDANGYMAGIMAETAQAELQRQANSAAHAAYARAFYGRVDAIREKLQRASDAADQLVRGTELNKQGAGGLTEGLTGAGDGARRISESVQQIADTTAQLDRRLDALTEPTPRPLPDATTTADGDAQAALNAAQEARTRAMALQEQVGSLSARAEQLADSTEMLNSSIETLISGSEVLLTGAEQLTGGARKLAGLIDDSLAGIPPTSPTRVAQAAEVLGSPTVFDVRNLNPAHVYGRGVAPFFFAIALWVSGLFASLLFKPVNLRALAGRTGAATIALAGWLPVAVLGVLGALALLAVAEFGPGLAPQQPGVTVGLLALAAAAFAAVVHFLRTWLGPVGGVLSLVLLVVQLTASGGLYPMETTPAPFQAIHPLLPMTYLVDGLRVTISGGLTEHLVRDLAVLGGFLVVFLALTVLVVWRQRTWTVGRLHSQIRP